jgi:DNA-directed RNA polymerase subunit RPC12/RpoP
MDRSIEKRLSDRAVAIGRAGDPSGLAELIVLSKAESPLVRRLAVSAIGKLAGLADAKSAVSSLRPRLPDPHPQVRQYAIKALIAYGADSGVVLHDLKDIIANPAEKDYNHRDAEKAVSVISEALRIREKQAEHRCVKCNAAINADEYARSMKAFQRVYCDKCFDEVFLKRRNYDTEVELNKTIETRSGTLVQSDGERIISDYLHANGISFRYDERIRLIEGFAIRPDFYLPEYDVYIEYWGMDTLDYKIGMMKKQKLYRQEGKKLISLYFKDKGRLTEILEDKLTGFMTSGNGVRTIDVKNKGAK